MVEVRQFVLKHNDVLARMLRRRFEQAGVVVISMVSTPGAGKTALLEYTLTRMRAEGLRVAALVGDLATENDARRLARTGASVRQIVTGTIGHLDADMVQNAIAGWTLTDFDILFIENVGNMVCPSSYDLGEQLRLVLMSVTEGEDKPLKYPTIFNTADVCVITKMDLAAAAEFDLQSARENIHAVRPGMRIMELSVKSGQGVEDYMAFLDSKLVVQENHMDLQLNIENPVNLVRRLSSHDTKVL
jgi:hydrogenase nickel incorporation protein HypB